MIGLSNDGRRRLGDGRHAGDRFDRRVTQMMRRRAREDCEKMRSTSFHGA
jgi:hypothetical protein